MKKAWVEPSVENLGIEKTAQGRHVSTQFDEIRVDQNGNYWVSFNSGAETPVNPVGPIEVPDGN
ncbi:hypothetical protein SAMN05216249_11268 [Acetitomaculum ruminis DSM 5522]|uniref:Uncharacterized protein n=1 Tax=Acetitomaculum ruminis DSM 5522 TaxID=1120918 RepID=A0A1I0Z2W5_9FIRM|nr:hypothetical protein [Acetitomaculum ruminis]SFB19436.1 hypothetical protein SAMN05216249_11268 [Acetitomaculum ruminis DSM 5522]